MTSTKYHKAGIIQIYENDIELEQRLQGKDKG